MKVVRSKRNLSTTPDTDRMWSAHIWQDCPWEDIVSGHVNGAWDFDDFVKFPITPPTTEGNWGPYAMFSSTGGTAANLSATTLGGVLALGSDGDDEGASLRTVSTPYRIDTDQKKLWFECRVKSSTITDTKHGFFIGLWENVALTATVPIAAAGTLSDNNFVGFHRLEGDGDQIDFVYKANGVTQVTVDADMLDVGTTALEADTWVKLGMVFEHREDLYTGTKFVLTPFYNGIRGDTKTIPAADGTDFPNDVAMGFAFAVLNATGSTPGTSSIDWFRIAQLYEEPN